MSVSGHDDEFRQLFAQEAATRLSRLGAQLLELEQTGTTPELVASIFREAHTIKGAAAVVGFADASRVAHALEDLLEGVRAGDDDAGPELIDVALAAVDGLTAMVPRLVAGEDCSVEADALEARVRAWRAPVPAAVAVSVAIGATTDEAQARSSAPAPYAPAPYAPRSPTTEFETVSVPVERLDELVRLVGESAAAHLRVGQILTERLDVDAGTVPEFRDLSRVLTQLQERTMRARMVPIATITDQLHRAVRDLARSLGKDVRWDVRGADTEIDRGVLQHLADPLLHLVRNAVDHGVETPAERAAIGKDPQAEVRLHAMQLGPEVVITVTDDGHGVDVARVRDEAARLGSDVSSLSDDEVLHLVFRSGVSTADAVSEVSGRGVGLDVVRASVDAIRGRVEIRSEPGAGTEFRVIVPITLAVLPCLLVEVAGGRYAIPMHSVTLAQAHDAEREARAEGRPRVWVGDTTVPISSLRDTLGIGLGIGGEPTSTGPVVVVAGVTHRHAFRVDALVGQRDVVVKGLGGSLPRLDAFAGASVEPDGSIVLVLDVPGLIERARLGVPGDDTPIAATGDDAEPAGSRRSILVVDDALTVRELQRSILERAGFDVRVASDGVEALAMLAEHATDLVLTDIEMPRLDGFGLTEAIRAHPTLANLPVLVLTSRASEADRQRGLDVGADAYIVKSAFDEESLLRAVNGLLGRGR